MKIKEKYGSVAFNYIPLVFFVVVALYYGESTYKLHEDWEFCIKRDGWIWFLGVHPLYYLFCKGVALIGIMLAILLGFKAARETNNYKKFPLTGMSLTTGAAGGLISVDTYTQYTKSFPAATASDNGGEYFTVIDNLFHTIGASLIMIICFCLIFPCLRSKFFTEMGTRGTLQKIYGGNHGEDIRWPEVEKLLVACGVTVNYQIVDNEVYQINIVRNNKFLYLDRSIFNGVAIQFVTVKRIKDFLQDVGIKP